MIVIREYPHVARGRIGTELPILHGVLVTDEAGLPIKTATPAPGGVNVELEAKTHFVELENKGAAVAYVAVRPKPLFSVPLLATTNHKSIPVGETVLIGVPAGAIINFVE